MRSGLFKLVMLVLLALQLLAAAQLQAARIPAAAPASFATAGHAAQQAPGGQAQLHPAALQSIKCPMHQGDTHKSRALHGHDCCHAGGCQCQGLSASANCVTPSYAMTGPGLPLPALSGVPPISARIDEFLRPPIA
jgi:hypothetical protein